MHPYIQGNWVLKQMCQHYFGLFVFHWVCSYLPTSAMTIKTNGSNRMYFIKSQLHKKIWFGDASYSGDLDKDFFGRAPARSKLLLLRNCKKKMCTQEFSQLTVQYVTPYFTVTYPGIHHLFCTSSAIAPPLLLPFYPQALPVQFETLEWEICYHSQVSVKHIILHPWFSLCIFISSPSLFIFFASDPTSIMLIWGMQWLPLPLTSSHFCIHSASLARVSKRLISKC